MKVLRSIIKSPTPPEFTNVAWFDTIERKLKFFNLGEWVNMEDEDLSSLLTKEDAEEMYAKKEDIPSSIVPEAPKDNKTYGRNNGAWSPITIPEGETIIDLGEINFNPNNKSPEFIFNNMVTKPGLYRFTTPYYYSNGLLLAQESRDLTVGTNTKDLVYSLWMTLEQGNNSGNPSYVLYAVSIDRGIWKKVTQNFTSW